MTDEVTPKNIHPHTGTVMVVDDNPNNLRVLAELLHGCGCQVRPVNNGRMALELARRETVNVDLILLDIRMPGMDGYEVCRQLKTHPRIRDIPVIFISALHEPLDKVKAFELGAVDYVTKPFHTEEVLARVNTHLELHRLRQHLEKMVEDRTSELREVNAGLQKALQVKNEFLNMMHHEFRTPLNAVLGVADFLKTLTVSEQNLLEFAEILDQSGWRLLRLLDNLLTLSSMSAGTLTKTEEPEITDITRLCHECIKSIEPIAIEKNIQVHLSCPEALMLPIPMRYSRLRQILHNLLDNAIKFTPAEGEIGLEIMDTDNQLICHVWDSGIGIPEQAQQKIFMPFTQLNQGDMRAYEGAGVGLTLVDNLVRLHNGRINIYEREGGGTLFEVTLPYPAAGQLDSAQSD